MPYICMIEHIQIMKRSILFILMLTLSIQLYSQANPVTTSLPFLLINTDAKSAGMGDIGVGTASDANSLFHNPAKIAFNKNQLSFGANYTPWLRNLTDDIFAGNISVINRVNEKSAWGADIKYFSLGEIQKTTDTGDENGTINPNEFALSGYYAMKLSEKYSMGIGLRYISSNLDIGDSNNAVNTLAVDVSGLYQSTIESYGSFEGRYRLGFNLANLGPKVEYVIGQKNFIPTILKIGGGFDFILDDFNIVGVSTEFKKLLVPADANSDTGWIGGIFESLGDSKELKEISIAFGAEYIYNEAFAIRAGYYYESELAGNRQYATLGAGFKTNAFSADLSYLINTSNINNPLENTLRFSLSFDLGQIYEN